MRPLTKNRADLLNLFLTNPDRTFYMHEIGRILAKNPGTFQRMINSLVSEGILESEYKANSRYFKVNKNYPLLKELKSIVSKTVGVIGILKNSLTEIGRIKFAFIYGSYAKARETYLSDIDLIIIGTPKEDDLVKKLDKLEKKLQRDINYKLYTLDNFRKEIENKEPLILEILRDKKIMIIGEEFR